MSAERSPPLWNLPNLRHRASTTACSVDPGQTSSSQVGRASTDRLHQCREVAEDSLEQFSAQCTFLEDTTPISPSRPVLNPQKVLCCPFSNLRATSLRLQSNEHTWDTLLLRFLRLEPGELINSLSRNHIIEVRVSKTINQEQDLATQARNSPGSKHRSAQIQPGIGSDLVVNKTDRPRYFGVHLLDGINPPAQPSPPTTPTKMHPKGRYIELPLSEKFVDRLNQAGSICFWCNEHGLWYEVSIFSGNREGSWRDTARTSPVL